MDYIRNFRPMFGCLTHGLDENSNLQIVAILKKRTKKGYDLTYTADQSKVAKCNFIKFK